jgi:hypothetical protein
VPDAVQKPQQSAQTVKPSDELPAETDPDPDEKGPAGFRERTEVDRQLKKIIEDYGQYDLYSHKSRISLKLLLLGVLILIGLVVFGFYYIYPTVANVAGVASASRHSPQAAVGSAPEAGNGLTAPLALHGKDVVHGTN